MDSLWILLSFEEHASVALFADGDSVDSAVGDDSSGIVPIDA